MTRRLKDIILKLGTGESSHGSNPYQSYNTQQEYHLKKKLEVVLTFLTSFSWWNIYSNKALAKFWREAYFVKFSLAKLMNGPSGVDNMEAYHGK